MTEKTGVVADELSSTQQLALSAFTGTQHKFQEGYHGIDPTPVKLSSFDPILDFVSPGEWSVFNRYFVKDGIAELIADTKPGEKIGTERTQAMANAKLMSFAKRLLVALRHCERAMNTQVQMCHERRKDFDNPAKFGRPADWQAMVAEMYAQTAEPLQHAREVLKELNKGAVV